MNRLPIDVEIRLNLSITVGNLTFITGGGAPQVFKCNLYIPYLLYGLCEHLGHLYVRDDVIVTSSSPSDDSVEENERISVPDDSAEDEDDASVDDEDDES